MFGEVLYDWLKEKNFQIRRMRYDECRTHFCFSSSLFYFNSVIDSQTFLYSLSLSRSLDAIFLTFYHDTTKTQSKPTNQCQLSMDVIQEIPTWIELISIFAFLCHRQKQTSKRSIMNNVTLNVHSRWNFSNLDSASTRWLMTLFYATMFENNRRSMNFEMSSIDKTEVCQRNMWRKLSSMTNTIDKDNRNIFILEFSFRFH